MDDKQRQLALIQIEKERRRRKQSGGSDSLRKAAVAGSGAASGLVGALPDLASIPTRVAAGVVGLGAKGVEAATGGQYGTGVKEYAFDLATQPTFTEQAQQAINKATGGYTEAKTTGERMLQSGFQVAGSLPAGGPLGRALTSAGTAMKVTSPKASTVARGLGAYMTPKSAAEYVAAAGAGAGAQGVSEFAGDNPWINAAGQVAGAVTGGAVGLGTARMGQNLLSAASRRVAPPTGQGYQLVGKRGLAEPSPADEFSKIGKTVRDEAKVSKGIMQSKYDLAEKAAPMAIIKPQAVSDLRKRIMQEIADASDQKVITEFADKLKFIDRKIAEKGYLTTGEIARGMRREFSIKTDSADGVDRSIGGKGIRLVDDFLDNALDSGMVSNATKQNIRQWKDATSFAKKHAERFMDAQDIADIIDDRISSGQPLNPSEIMSKFDYNSPKVGNQWNSVVKATPPKLHGYVNETMRKGVMHKMLQDSLRQSPSGLEIDESAFLGRLMQLRNNKEVWMKFTPEQRTAMESLRANLAGQRGKVRQAKNFVAATIFGMFQRQAMGASGEIAQGLAGPLQAKMDDIIKFLDKPVPIDVKKSGSLVRPTGAALLQQSGESDNLNQ